jgi:hypothetical protein
MRSLQQFWSTRRIGEDRVTLARLGQLRIWLARAEREWAIAHEFGESEDLMDIAQVPEDVVPSKLSWSDMVFPEAPRDFSFHACSPDRPVVVKPDRPIAIPPGHKGTFYAKFPVSVLIALNIGKKEVSLGNILSSALCDTWFGSMTEGDYCFALPHPATLDVEGLQPRPNEVVCPIEIDNNSDGTVIMEKFCLRTGQLRLFSGNTHLWSTGVRIQCEDLFRSISVRYSGKKPETGENLVEVSGARKKEETGLQRLGFATSFSKDLVLKK